MSPVYLCGVRWSYIYFISAIYKNIEVVWSAVDVDGFKRVKAIFQLLKKFKNLLINPEFDSFS